MKVNDLRVGNWVKCKTIDGCKFGKICDILDIGYFVARCDGVEYRGKFDNIGVDIESIEPIELTNELLENLGFQLTDKPIVKTDLRLQPHFVYRKSIENTHINIDPVQLFILQTGIGNGNMVNIRDVKHLHQIQNAYYMVTGEELNIEL